eukprot:GAHX01000262.1.p1 GENE.GAHX01000262.1~~GAHX01000262.1.p1  ORF type:complete len:148 (-),score=30.95 GAHX01000262.1:29-472(-)
MASKGVKKTRKKRGHVSAGHGRVGKHRKHAAGRGCAGGLTFHRNLFERYHPGFFGKKGKREYHANHNAKYRPILNVERLGYIMENADNFSSMDKDRIPVIDITQFGYHKLLGKGSIRETPMIVKAKYFSEKAKEKIQSVGGVCELIA